MFLLFILSIMLIIWALHSMHKPDKKSAEQRLEDANKIANLPNINIVGHELTSAQKIMELWPSDSDVLYVLRYEKDSKFIYLQMRDGRYIHCPLNQLDVFFEYAKKPSIRVVCTYGNAKFSFYEYSNVFTSDEWKIIYYVLSLAGVTHNIGDLRKFSKNGSQLNGINNILRKI